MMQTHSRNRAFTPTPIKIGVSSRSERGFTIIEILVVVAIIGILAGTLILNMQDAQRQSRDGKRQADLKTVQGAVENYKRDYGRYPEGCNGANNLSGEDGSGHACSGGDYIEGLVGTYIPALPADPNPSVNNAGYVYVTNSDGSVYKFMALDSVEVQTVDFGTNQMVDFARCGNLNLSSSICSTSPNCTDTNTYAVYGGFANGSTDADVLNNTRAIVCNK